MLSNVVVADGHGAYTGVCWKGSTGANAEQGVPASEEHQQ